MLQTIGRRGNGLVRFMNSYREVSHLPHPLLKLYNAGELLKEVVQLMQITLKNNSATLNSQILPRELTAQ